MTFTRHLFYLLLLSLLGGCELPSLLGRDHGDAVIGRGDTRIGKAILARVAGHAGSTGVHPLLTPDDAFAARLLLANAAERTLDLQYYIWHGDKTGMILFRALRSAADRGVSVRLLLDDNNTGKLDGLLSELNAHPNIEVRLFNPFVIRSPRWLGYLTNFSRINRRMHNKTFTADGNVTLIGGRNIGDEYFGMTNNVAFADLDVIAIGKVVDDVSVDFAAYWNSASAYPAATLLPAPAEPPEHASPRDREAGGPDEASAAYVKAIEASDFVRDIVYGDFPLTWAPVTLVSDSPEKVLGLSGTAPLLYADLTAAIGTPASSVDLVSPYFVPTDIGVEALAAMARQGVQIRILTNSYEATDVAAVHAGYARQRKRLLQAGVRLFELRRATPGQGTGRNHRMGAASSSGLSLHAKMLCIDRAKVFVGSFNFDPRSINLNTESGIVIHSAPLAMQINLALDRRISTGAYEVKLSDAGDLYWRGQANGKEVILTSEPGMTALHKFGLYFLSMLPIEWLL